VIPSLDGVRLVDLSVPLQHRAASEPFPARIRWVDHRRGFWQMRWLFGTRKRDLEASGGLGWAVEEVRALTHTGTHVDAPWHYGPVSGGKRARTIDEIPLEWCLAPGVRVDVRDLADGEEITVARLEERLGAAGHRLSPGDIVLLWTGADERIGTREYFRQPGLGREGTLWLVEQGVRVIGIDAYTIDRPFRHMKADFLRTGDGRHVWPAHFAGIEREYCQIEKLANLGALPAATGFWVSCLPVKIERASAGWCRAVALVPRKG
jgi:kynurenine formamidase